MQTATLLHNRSAGDDSFTPEQLISKIREQGINCIYKSVKDDNWQDIDNSTDFLIVAGGDGTVRKVTETLLEKKLHKNYPIALLPAGTANNIARTLNISNDEDEVISAWKSPNLRKFDVGRINNLPGAEFFLESFGYGIFPFLMKQMREVDRELKDAPEKKLQVATELLKAIIQDYKPSYCHLEIDGCDHSGRFLLVEIMNTQSIGPNLILSPHAEPGDGEFEVVLIPEGQKEKLLNYLSDKLSGIENQVLFDICKAKKIRIRCDNRLAHVDDQIIEAEQLAEVNIELIEGLLTFMA